MSKPFLRYEDVPLVLASEGELPTMIFASNATLSVTQPIEAKRFVDDYVISFDKQTGDITINGVITTDATNEVNSTSDVNVSSSATSESETEHNTNIVLTGSVISAQLYVSSFAIVEDLNTYVKHFEWVPTKIVFIPNIDRQR